MSFFSSNFVQEEMKAITELQDRIYGKVFSFSTMNNDDKLEHVELLEELLNKQKILYARMTLSDDPESSAQQLGFPPDVDLNYVFSNMTNIIEKMKKTINESA